MGYYDHEGDDLIGRFLGLAGVLVDLTVSEAAYAEGLSPADKAWIDKCIADRAIEKNDPVKLRKYCICMHDIVEDNEPFTVTELERSYPPAHAMCMEESGLLP
jgi:hypothetical protein